MLRKCYIIAFYRKISYNKATEKAVCRRNQSAGRPLFILAAGQGRPKILYAEEKERMMERKRRIAMFTVAPAIIFLITYYIYYLQASVPGGGDIVKHMNAALSLDMVLKISDCGWHFVCWLFYVCLPIPIEEAASLATASFNAFTAVLVIWIIDRYYGKNMKRVVFPTVITLVSLLVGPLYLRFYNPNYYLGQGSPNIWHNPTSVAVRPFMLWVTVLTMDYWSCDKEERVSVGKRTMKKTTAYELGLGVLLFISTLVKPSFLMVYCPVCGIVILYRLIKRKGKGFWELVKQNLYFLPSLAVFLWQYIKIFIFGGATGSNAGIEIAFFKVARLYAPSVLFSLILKMAFPILVIVIWRKKIFKDKLFQMVFGMALMGLAITWTLAETGDRAKHGNFGWSNILASSFLWIFCVIFYAREWDEEKETIMENTMRKVKYAVPAVILLWHLVAGLYSMTTYMREFT